ncbi:Hsp20/alpha crystallin family protein [Myxococcota bacterium]
MLTLWSPYGGLSNWSRELDRLLGWSADNGNAGGCVPAVDIEEHENQVVIRADVPGVDEKNLEVSVHEGTLLLSGKRENGKCENGQAKTSERTGYRERGLGTFCRQFRLGTDVDDTKIEASYHQGVLTVVVPKKEAAKPRQIPVQAS